VSYSICEKSFCDIFKTSLQRLCINSAWSLMCQLLLGCIQLVLKVSIWCLYHHKTTIILEGMLINCINLDAVVRVYVFFWRVINVRNSLPDSIIFKILRSFKHTLKTCVLSVTESEGHKPLVFTIAVNILSHVTKLYYSKVYQQFKCLVACNSAFLVSEGFVPILDKCQFSKLLRACQLVILWKYCDMWIVKFFKVSK